MGHRRWLELLVDGAEDAALNGHRRELLDQHVDAKLVDAEFGLAVRLHEQLDERTALAHLAGQLASVRQLDQVLGYIAVQTRRLLRCDVAYLALVDGDALQVRFSEGIMSPSNRDITMSLTDGLAGPIVTTGESRSTSDYLADKEIAHHPAADKLVKDEQLHSIVGVPLRARDETLGVLFAAQRRRRPFAATDVALLAALAGHAAVAIENARLFDAERFANKRLNANAAILDRAIALHESLTATIVGGGGPVEVLEVLAETLHARVQLIDSTDRPQAGPDLGALRPAALVAASGRRTQRLDVDPDGHLLLCPVVAGVDHLGVDHLGYDYLGCIVVHSDAALDDAEVRLVERGAMGIALTLVRDRAIDEATTRNRGEILSALLERGDTDTDTLRRRAAAANVDLSAEHILAVVKLEDGEARDICVDLARKDGLMTERAGRTILLVPATKSLEALAGHATIGRCPVDNGVAAVPDAYSAARRVLHALLALGKHHLDADTDAVGIYRYLIAVDSAGGTAKFIRRTAGPLLDYDKKHGSDLAATVVEYLVPGRSHKITAEILGIHTNTLTQRLNRVSAILGDWSDPDKAVDLQVALKLHRLTGTLGDD